MLLAGLLVLSTVSPASAASYAMGDAGVTLNLPGSWEMTRWSDWDFTAKSDAGMALKVWETPWQLDFDERFKADVVKVYTDDLDSQRGGDIQVTVGTPGPLGAVTALPSTVHFKFDRNGTPGVAHAEAVAVDGKVLHFVVYAPASNAARARAGVEAIVAGMTIQKGPADLSSTGGVQKTTHGFSVTLPPGWRTALPTEKAEMDTLAATAALAKPDQCFAAARPALSGAEGLFVCEADQVLAIVDEYSFDGESEKLKGLIFGKAAAKIPKATSVAGKDRMGILYAPAINEHDLRLGVMPYDRGQAMTWLVGPSGSGPDLDAAAKAVLTGLVYEGPDGGKPPFGVGDEVVHVLTYRPFHPAVLACVGMALVVFGGLVALILRPRGKRSDEPAY